jgi:uncharacterized SAM-binding protein YcdF (DUF218 family)
MLHYASKLTSVLWQPLNWVALLLLVGVFLLFARSQRMLRWGRKLCVAATALLLLLGWQALPESLIRTLEDRYSQPPADLSKFSGMVSLGGAFSALDGRLHVLPDLGGSGERVVAPIPVMNRHGHMRLIFTSGDASIGKIEGPEADVAKTYFATMGVDMSRVLFETRSRNTYENAAFTNQLPGVDISQPWLLVTSAWHMPRAMATFQKMGWNVTALPVDYFSSSETRWLSYSLFRGAEAWQIALHEYIGLAAYWIAGRI